MSRYINSTYSSGILLLNPGDNPVTVGPAAYIGGSAVGFGLFGTGGTAWTIANEATIVAGATNGIGVDLTTGGMLTNGSTGVATPVISGAAYGVLITGGPANVANYGTISGASGVSFYQVVGGVTFTSTGTVVNAGTIAGSGGTAVRFGSGTERLVVDPGAVFVGNVIGGSGANTMELASAASAGTIGGIGSCFTGFGSILVDAGAAWTLTGANTVASGASLTDAGVLTVTGSLVNAGTIGGAGQLVDAGSLINAGSIGTGLTLTGGTLTNQAGGTVTGTVYGIAGSNRVTNLGRLNGILLATGGSVSNGSSLSTGAIVAGVQYGVAVHGGTGVIVNDRAISASATSGFAVTLGAGGVVTNGAAGLTSASIKGGSSGVFVTGAAGTLTNYGSISGVNNGAAFSKAGTVANFGTVTGTTFYGLVLNAGGVVTNGGGTSHATVNGGSDGILLRGGSGTVTNLGVDLGHGICRCRPIGRWRDHQRHGRVDHRRHVRRVRGRDVGDGCQLRRDRRNDGRWHLCCLGRDRDQRLDRRPLGAHPWRLLRHRHREPKGHDFQLRLDRRHYGRRRISAGRRHGDKQRRSADLRRHGRPADHRRR